MLDEAARDHVVSADAPAKWLDGETVPQPEPDCEPPRLKVLVVEDNAADYERIEWCLLHMARYEPQITLAGNPGAARMAIACDDFDVVLVGCRQEAASRADTLCAVQGARGSGPALLLTSGPAGADGEWGSLLKPELSPKALEAAILEAIRDHARRGGGTGAAAGPLAGRVQATGEDGRVRQELIAEIERCALGIERELQGQPRFAASRWAAAKVRCLAANLAPLEAGGSRARASETSAARLARRSVFDVQSVVVDVALAARCEARESAAGPGTEIEMVLLDRPVHARGDWNALAGILAEIVAGAAAGSVRPGRIVLAVSEGSGGAELQVDWTTGAGPEQVVPSSRIVMAPFGGWITRSCLPGNRRRVLIRLPSRTA